MPARALNDVCYEGLASCIRTIALAQPDDRLAVFQNMAREAAPYVREGGIDISMYMDRFQNAAVAHGLVEVHGRDRIQAILTKALKEPLILSSHAPESQRWEQQDKERASRPGKKHAADTDDEAGTGGEKGRKPKQADILIGIADNAALFHTPAPDDDAFADIAINDHRETHRVRGRIFRGWLRHKYFELTGSACNSEALQVAIDTVEAKARYKGPEQHVHIRIAGADDAIYIDLGDLAWKAIKVTASGWQIVNDPPVRFTRSQSTKPLPIPERGGSIDLLRPFCNLKTRDEFVVLIGHVLGTLRPDANYLVLVTTGEQGSCKSTLFRLIVRLVDPRSPELRSLPKDEDDLITAAKGAHALSFDNISGIQVWLSDAICRLATGGGAGKRKLYSDDDEILFDGRRPTFLNGIEDVVTRGDLVDRSNIFSLEVIPENKRRTEAEIDAEFADKAPKILGALLDGLVAGLNNLSSVKITDKPRMADFALWAEACTRAYWPAETFIKAYRKNLAASVELVLEASTVGTAVRLFMEARQEWCGTAQELLGLLTPLVGEHISREREWPKRPLSGKLKRAAPALRKIGIHVTLGGRFGHAGERIVTIEKWGQPDYRPEASSASSASPLAPNKNNGLAADDADDRPVSADDHALFPNDPLTIADETIVSGDPSQNNGSDDADGADDELVLYSEKVGAENTDDMLTYAEADGDLDGSPDRPREAGERCAQCRGSPDGKEQQYQQRGAIVLLHPECRPYWLKDHPQ